MEQQVRLVNDADHQILAWLRSEVGDERVARAIHHLGRVRKPYVSALCRYLGIRPPISIQRPIHRITADHTIGDHYLSLIRRHLANHPAR